MPSNYRRRTYRAALRRHWTPDSIVINRSPTSAVVSTAIVTVSTSVRPVLVQLGRCTLGFTSQTATEQNIAVALAIGNQTLGPNAIQVTADQPLCPNGQVNVVASAIMAMPAAQNPTTLQLPFNILRRQFVLQPGWALYYQVISSANVASDALTGIINYKTAQY